MGRRIRLLSVIDVSIRETLALSVDRSLPGSRVVRVLDRLVSERLSPSQFVLDNGSEMIRQVLEQWTH